MRDEHLVEKFEIATAPPFAGRQANPVLVFGIARFVTQAARLGAQMIGQLRERTGFFGRDHDRAKEKRSGEGETE